MSEDLKPLIKTIADSGVLTRQEMETCFDTILEGSDACSDGGIYHRVENERRNPARYRRWRQCFAPPYGVGFC